MKLTMQATEPFLTLPEDAVIQVIVNEVTDREATNRTTGESWSTISFRFKILELPSHLGDTYDVLIGQTIFGSVPAKLTDHQDNKLRQWTEALLDMELEPGFEFDTEMLVGRKARAVITNYSKKDSTVVNHKVKGLLPLVPATVVGGGLTQTFFDEPPF